jgi:hypothetical protein
MAFVSDHCVLLKFYFEVDFTYDRFFLARVVVVVITFCLVLVEMKPMESHDVMTNPHAVMELCASQSARLEEAHESGHAADTSTPHEGEGHHPTDVHGRRLHGLTCEVQWCTFNESAIVDGAIISPLCIPDCEITGACANFKKGCSIESYEITDEDTCHEHGGTWGHSFLHNYLLRYNWPKAQTHLAASFVLMTMWFVSLSIYTCTCTLE